MTVYAKRAERTTQGSTCMASMSRDMATGSAAGRPNTGRSPEVWSEGLGWYALIVAETLAVCRRTTPSERRWRTSSAAWPPAQTHAGRTKRPMVPGRGQGRPAEIGRYLGSAMFTYAIQRGIELGLIDKNEYAPVVQKGYKGIVENARINDKGS